MSWDLLNEDEDDIFSGTPKSKFWDIAKQSNEEIVEDVFDKIVEEYAIMEKLLEQFMSDEEIERAFNSMPISDSAELENRKKGLYMQFTTEIVQRLDSWV